MNVERWRKLLAGERRRLEEALAAGQNEREDGEGRIAELQERLDDVARAERRLEDGTYGTSVGSGGPIPDARLEVIPTAERTGEVHEGEGGAPAAGSPTPTTSWWTASTSPSAELGVAARHGTRLWVAHGIRPRGVGTSSPDPRRGAPAMADATDDARPLP